MVRIRYLVCALFASLPTHALSDHGLKAACCSHNLKTDFQLRDELFATDESNRRLMSSMQLAQESVVPSRGIKPGFPQPPKPSTSDLPTRKVKQNLRDNTDQFENTMWAIVKESNDPADYDAYLEIYPNGRYSAIARKALHKLRTPSNPARSAPRKPRAERETRAIEPSTLEESLKLTREERTLIQRALNAKNHGAGKADGLFGHRTRGAIWRYQSAMGMQETGYLTGIQAKELVVLGERIAASSTPDRSASLVSPPTPSRAIASVDDKNVPNPNTLISTANTFPAPRYSPGTTFAIKRRSLSKEDAVFDLNYRGKSEHGYDFGAFEMFEDFRIARHGMSPPLYMSPIRFPLQLGDAWSYDANFQVKGGKCVIKRHMKAKVGKATENFLISGKKISVIKILHHGTQVRSCLGRAFTPDEVSREFLYSPQIGMFVLDRIKVLTASGHLLADQRRELISYTSPSN